VSVTTVIVGLAAFYAVALVVVFADARGLRTSRRRDVSSKGTSGNFTVVVVLLLLVAVWVAALLGFALTAVEGLEWME
jgi:hypothetical protein